MLCEQGYVGMVLCLFGGNRRRQPSFSVLETHPSIFPVELSQLGHTRILIVHPPFAWVCQDGKGVALVVAVLT